MTARDTGRVFWKRIEELGVYDARSTTKHVSEDNQKRPFYSWSEEEEMGQLQSGPRDWSQQALDLKKFLQLERHSVKKRLKADALDKELRRDGES